MTPKSKSLLSHRSSLSHRFIGDSTEAGLNSRGLITLSDHLWQKKKKGQVGPSMEILFGTHPDRVNRVDDIQKHTKEPEVGARGGIK